MERTAVRRRVPIALAGLALVGVSCGTADAPADAAVATGGARFDPTPGAGFFAMPFPNPLRVRDDATLVVADFPNPRRNVILARLLNALETLPTGFAANAAVFVPFDVALDPAGIPMTTTQARADETFQLVDVDPTSPRRGQRVPLRVSFKAEQETFTPADTLVLWPEPGAVLRHGNLYAAVVLDSARSADGRPLATPPALRSLLDGGVGDPRLMTGFAALREQLGRDGIATGRVRAATVFRTGDPFGEMDRLRDAVASRPPPAASELRPLRVHDTFCVIEGRVTLPLFQDGARPYSTEGGAIRFDASGAPVQTGEESVRFALTVPRRRTPRDGFPVLLYAAGQGGLYTQFVDRGPMSETAMGIGPALQLADVGIAGLSIEAPLVGPRHPTGSFDGLDFFNVSNPIAFRDNVRQAAVDFTSLLRLTETLSVPAALCPDAGPDPIHLNPTRRLFWGHSTGATIGAVVLGAEPALHAGMLSGVGGSWLHNLVLKSEPVAFASLVRLLLGYQGDDRVDLFDAPLHLAQTFWEPIEPMNWAQRWTTTPRAGQNPRDVLLIEGVIDGYFPPPAVNALTLAAGADALDPLVDDSMLGALRLAGRAARTSPITANVTVGSGAATLAVVQHRQPMGISGHYVPFELPGPKYQYRCFFDAVVRTGRGVVLAPAADALAACP